MIVESISLTNFRAIKQLDLEFKPGINVIAGINGIGKSSILVAIAKLLSRALPKFTQCTESVQNFSDDDIQDDLLTLAASARIWIGKHTVLLMVRRLRTIEVVRASAWGRVEEIRRQKKQARGDKKKLAVLRRDETEALRSLQDVESALVVLMGNVTPGKRTGHFDTAHEDAEKTLNKLRPEPNPPIAIYYSTKRYFRAQSVPVVRAEPFQPSQAYRDSLTGADVDVSDVMLWLRVVKFGAYLSKAKASRLFEAFNTALERFLPGFSNLEVVQDEEQTTTMNKLLKRGPRAYLAIKKNRKPIRVRQLSDGERGMLALVLDLTRRLTIANSDMADPVKDGRAVVLIDEIELHLHPSWQRTVLDRLSQTFKGCQFIVTTHSPQIIGQAHSGRVQMLSLDKARRVSVRALTQTFGMDSNWILETEMGSTERDPAFDSRLEKVHQLIDRGEFKAARREAEAIRKELGTFPDIVRALAKLKRLEFVGANAKNK